MDWNWVTFGGSAVVLGLIAAGWRHVRSVWQHISSRVVMVVTVHDCAADAVISYCTHNLKRSMFGPRTYWGCNVFVRPRHRREGVVVEQLGQGSQLFWQGWRPLWVARTSGTLNDNGSSTNHIFAEPVQLTFFRGAFDADDFLQAAMEYYNERRLGKGLSRYQIYPCFGTAGKLVGLSNEPVSFRGEGRSKDDSESVRQHRLLRWKHDEIGPIHGSPGGKAMDCLAMTPAIAALWQRLQLWRENRDWFHRRGLPWKYGALLHGIPGTGKTSFVRAVAEDFDIPIFSMGLSSMYNNELQERWVDAVSSAPAIVLVEDIDGVFRGRTPTSDKIQLTFDGLLNCIDGVERANGVLLFVTTNDPSTLDAALGGPSADGAMMSRPGRIDSAVEFGLPDEAGRRKLISRILSDWPELLERTLRDCVGLTGAQIERRCIDIAQQRYWEEVEQRLSKQNGHKLHSDAVGR